MKCCVNDKIYMISDDYYENEGTEGIIYRIGNTAYKIYKQNRSSKDKLSEEDVKYLSNIDTKRIIMPENPIYSNGIFCGYTMPFIQGYSKENIKNMSMNQLIEELKLIEEDLKKLKDKSVDIDDLTDDNFLYNSKINIIDLGSYIINSNISKKELEVQNRRKYNEFVIKYILSKAVKLTQKQINDLLIRYDLDEYMSDMLLFDITSSENIKKFVKKIIN